MKRTNGFWIVKGFASFILVCCVLSCHHQEKVKPCFTQDEIINQHLAASDTINDFLFSGDKRLTKEKEIYHLMNRIMQMYAAMPDSGVDSYRADWLWEEACRKEILDYIQIKSGEKRTILSHEETDSVFEEIDQLLSCYSAGGQAEMNSYTYVMGALAKYKTLKAYKDLQQSRSDTDYQNAIFHDYKQWDSVLCNLLSYCEYIQGDGMYSMAPMEANIALMSIHQCRYEELLQEAEIMKGRKLGLGKRFDWVAKEDFKKQQVWYVNYLRYDKEPIETVSDADSVYIYLDRWCKRHNGIALMLTDDGIRKEYLEYVSKKRFDVLRLLMNEMSYLDQPGQLSYGVFDKEAASRLQGTDNHNYLFHRGKFIYMTATSFDADYLDCRSDLNIVTIKDGEIESVRKAKDIYRREGYQDD